jgi:phospholipid/cholesterol/gamma-HCH transport system substrate-binding protein
VTRGKEFSVGLVIISAVAAAVVGTLWLQGTTFGPVRIETVLTETVGQLADGNAVTYRGVRIGQVEAIRVLDDGSGVEVTLVLGDGVRLPNDAAVVFGPESLFGDWQAEIVSGASYPSFPFYEVPASARASDRRAEGSRPIGGYALPELSRLTASAEQISGNLESLTDRLELAFSDETASSLSTTIANIQAITEEVRELVAQQSGVAAAITSHADSALAEIGIAAGAARRSFERIETAIGGAEPEALVADLREIATSLRRVSAELADSTSGLGVTLGRADSAFASLQRIAARIESGEGAVGRLLSDSTLAIRAESVLTQLDSLFADLRENPQRYVRLSIF